MTTEIWFGYEKMNMDVLRKYFDTNGNDSLLLQLPNFTKTKISSHNIKTGVDFFASNKTTFGVVFTGNITERNVSSFSTIDWMSPSYIIDSTINTWGEQDSQNSKEQASTLMRSTVLVPPVNCQQI